MRMRVTAVTMETCLLIFCACADNHVALLFINKVGGSRRGFGLSSIIQHIHLSGLLGVQIIEVLLYTEVAFVERLFCTQTVHLGPGATGLYSEVVVNRGSTVLSRIAAF